MHAGAAVAAVRLQHELLAVVARRTPSRSIGAVRRVGAPLADDARPQHVAAEQLALRDAEVARRQLLARQHLPAALVIEVAADRGDHAVLQEQRADGVEPLPVLLLEREQVAHLVVAVGDVDARVLVVDVVADEPQLARIGVRELDAASRCDSTRRGATARPDLPRRTSARRARDAACRAADRARMIEQHLQEQVALIARRVDRQQRVVARAASARRRASRASRRAAPSGCRRRPTGSAP